MEKLAVASLLVLLLFGIASSQTDKDSCHVYVVDVLKGKKAYEERFKRSPAERERAFAEAVTEFPEFYPVIGEEELTTKTYRFPRSSLVITASVFYTDESMASADGVDSMLIGIAVSRSAKRDAMSAENNSVAEVTMNEYRDTLRTERHVRVRGRLYKVGMECHCKEMPKAN